MPDLVVRNVPDDVLAAIDVQAAQAGLSRSEFVCRELSDAARRSVAPVETDDLGTFGERFSGLASADIMGRAWE